MTLASHRPDGRSNTKSVSARGYGPRYRRAVSLAQIEYFVAIAEEGHMGRAAQRLHVSQPPLSRQLRALEDELGAPLFTRTPRGMHLLPAGEAFLAEAQRILGAVAAARRAVERAGRDPSA